VFFDLEGSQQYDSNVRVRYTDAIRKALTHVDAVYVVADSRIVRMGATVAGIVIPQLRLVQRQEFGQRLEAALRENVV